MNKETIKKIRTKALMTQMEFANAVGASVCAVSNWEAGKVVISMRNWRKVLAFCKENGIDVEKL